MATPAHEETAPDPSSPSETVWTPEFNAAMTNLLDHLAEELALEYVRLMERAAEGPLSKHPNEEG
jgi:hypothetical protein